MFTKKKKDEPVFVDGINEKSAQVQMPEASEETPADSVPAEIVSEDMIQEEAPEKSSSGKTAETPEKKTDGKKKKGKGRKPVYLEEIPEEELDEREKARIRRYKRRKKEMRRVKVLLALFVLLILAGGATGGYFYLLSQGIDVISEVKNKGIIQGTASLFGNSGSGEKGSDASAAKPEEVTQAPAAEEQPAAQEEADGQTAPEAVQPETPAPVQTEAPEPASEAVQAAAGNEEVLAQAELMRMQYDYDAAIALLKAQEGYETDQALQAKAAEIESSKAACVEVSPDTVVHVFVHSLIVDPARAFDGDAGERGYNLNMVTVDEFRKIIQSLYDNGYVLVSLHDMGEIDENGQMQRKTFLLPEGKKPLVFSQDDVSYYHSYTNDGFADKLLVDENGEVKNQYTDADGNVSIGDYDMVPVLDTFVKEHPDFSYRGMKGIVVLTGYNGVFGYRTDSDYRERVSLQEDQRAWLEAHPDFDINADIAEATKVADAMKANGWEFASHTWGHIAVADVDLDWLAKDTQRWHDNVENIVGDTDMIIFAFGSDIGSWEGYSEDNEKFRLLKDAGFDYFCNVDGSTLSWVQFGNTYLRTGRMNLDGYRMATNPEILSPLFDVSQVYDYENRPPMSEWNQ